METWEAVFLGIIQGLAEFLPISSSGHLVLFKEIFDCPQAGLLFIVSLHVGTLVAVVIVLFPQVLEMLKGFLALGAFILRRKKDRALLEDPGTRMALFITLATVPTGILGLVFKKCLDDLFSSVMLAGAMLLVTGAVLLATRWLPRGASPKRPVSMRDALVIGVVQGLAVLPGISRSGSTISAGLFLGLDRTLVARFSFLLSIPAILGALVLEIAGGGEAGAPAGLCVLGGLAAAATGFFALKVLLRVVEKGKLHWFAPYCFAVGIAIFALKLF